MYINNDDDCTDAQQWIINQNTGIPGVFTIANKQDPALFLTAPINPSLRDLVTLAKKINKTGPDSPQQLWRIIPEIKSGYLRIQNFQAESGYFLNIRNGKSGEPIMLFKYTSDDDYEEFYIDRK